MKNKPCNTEGCNNPRWAKGLCLQHDKIANPYKYQIKPYESGMSPSSKPKSSDISNPKQKPIKHISDKQALRLKEYRKLRDEYMKEHPMCEAMLSGCTYFATDLHHKAGRIGNLLLDVRTFCALCRNCHSILETSPNYAQSLGFSTKRLEK